MVNIWRYEQLTMPPKAIARRLLKHPLFQASFPHYILGLGGSCRKGRLDPQFHQHLSQIPTSLSHEAGAFLSSKSG